MTLLGYRARSIATHNTVVTQSANIDATPSHSASRPGLFLFTPSQAVIRSAVLLARRVATSAGARQTDSKPVRRSSRYAPCLPGRLAGQAAAFPHHFRSRISSVIVLRICRALKLARQTLELTHSKSQSATPPKATTLICLENRPAQLVKARQRGCQDEQVRIYLATD